MYNNLATIKTKGSENNMDSTIKTNEISQASQVFTFMVATVIVLDVYTMPLLRFLSWGEFIFICMTPYFWLKTGGFRYVKGSLLWVFLFCIYGLFCSIIASFVIDGSARDIAVRLIREAFYYIIIFGYGLVLFDFKYFKRIASKIVLLLALFVIAQSVVYLLSGYLIPGLIPNVEINDGGITGQQMYQIILKNAGYMGYIKPNGFLCEPAHCAHCFFVYLLLILFEEDTYTREQQIIRAGIVSLAMVATMSTSAFIELAVAWIAWLIVGKRKGVLQVIIVVAAIFIAYIVVFRRADTSFSAVFERFTRMFTTSQTVVYSGNLRVLKGFNVFRSLPFIYKFFGIGFGAYNAAVSAGIIHLQGFDLYNEYMNSISYILVSSGLIGFTLYIGYFISIFSSRSLTGKLLILGGFIMALGSGIYCTSIYIWILLLIRHSEKVSI